MKISIVLCLAACLGIGAAEQRWIQGSYRNPAEGYAVDIPSGLKAMTGDQAGPERGVSIALPSGGKITVFGEPNSLEWKSPAEGVRWSLGVEKCRTGQRRVSAVRIGRLSGAEGTLACGERLLKVLLAFRPGGEPIYWIRLETVTADADRDDAILRRVASSLRMIRWE